MTATSYEFIGMAFLCSGATVTVASVVLFFVASGGMRMDNVDDLHTHDTYYAMFSVGQRLVCLLPFIAGLMLMASGLLIKRVAVGLKESLQNIEEAEQGGDGDAVEGI